MAGTKISALTAAAALGGTEAIPGVQSAANVKITATQIKTFTSASPTLVTPVLGVATGTSLTLSNGTSIAPVLVGGSATSGLYFATSGFDVGYVRAGSPMAVLGFQKIVQASLGVFGIAPSADPTATPDTGLSRISAGVIGVGTGAQGSVAGRLDLAGMNVAGGAFGGDGNWWSGNNLNIRGTTQLSFGAADVILTRGGVATLQHGNFDAAAPVAQTIKFQDVVAGTSNTAGVNATIQAPAGTGTGAGGSLIFQVAPAGSSGTAKNAWATALTIFPNRTVQFASSQIFSDGSYQTAAAGWLYWGGRTVLKSPSDGALTVSTNDGTTGLFTITAGASNLATFNGPITTTGTINAGAVVVNAGSIFAISSRLQIQAPADGVALVTNSTATDLTRLVFGTNNTSGVSFTKSTTTIQAKLGDGSAFTAIQGKLTTDTAYTAGDPTTTGYLLVYDSTGTAYRVPALAN